MDNRNQSMPYGFGQQPSWMLYQDAQPEKDNSLKKVALIGGAIIGFLILCIICVLVLGNKSDNKKEASATDAGIETKELIVDNKPLVQSFIDSVKAGAYVTQTQCRKMLNIGNKYTETYGGKTVDIASCSVSSMKVAQKIEEGKDYPYEPMTVLYLQTKNQCLKFPFYETLYSMQDYEVLDKQCPVEMTTVEVVKK